MAKLLNEIEWSDPIVPVVVDLDWEAEVKRRMGLVPDMLRRLSPIPWLRDICLKWDKFQATELPERLIHIAMLVTGQENACRYCYGAARAQMRIMGYSDKWISRIERDVQMADLKENERAFIRFCRNLSRSNPRPAKADREELIRLGYSPLAVAEMTFLVTSNCFYNRVATFIATPPVFALEKIADTFLGGLVRPIIARKLRKIQKIAVPPLNGAPSAFGNVIQALAGLPSASLLQEALEGAFSSPVLSWQLKMLMFAVIARALNCDFCLSEAKARLVNNGLTESGFETCLNTLGSPDLDEEEELILSWARETVHFQTGFIQAQTRALAEKIGEEALLEAVGVAALANTTVRLAMLLE